MHRRRKRRRRSSLFPRQPFAALPTPDEPAEPGAPAPATEIRVVGYGPEGLEVLPAEALEKQRGRFPVLWVQVTGLGDADAVTRVAQALGVHRLALEDILHGNQRPKTEDYGDHLFMVARTLEARDRIETRQVSLVLGQGFVATFVEGPVTGLGAVRERLKVDSSRLRSSGSDHLAYAILDAVIDELFPALDGYAERLELVEEEILAGATEETVEQIIDARYDLLAARRALVPLREAVSDLLRADTPLITEATRVHLRDCQDHAMQLTDLIESYQELGSGLMEVYLSSLSARTNQVMKVLTIISTIFIPLTFLAGVYGMNFNAGKSPLNMPETQWYYGYPVILVVMAIIAGSLLLYFRRQGWLGERPRASLKRSSWANPDGSR